MTSRDIIHIGPDAGRATLSPAQKKFNSLSKRITSQKKLLADWQYAMADCQQEAAKRLEPLRATLAGHQADLAELLDQLFLSHKFSRSQREKIAHLITELCDALIREHRRDDLKPLHDRYSVGGGFDAMERETDEMAAEFIQAMVMNEFGIALEPGDFDPADPLGSARRLEEKLRLQMEAQQIEAEAARPRRGNSARQRAKEERDRQEAVHVSKAIQAVYRQLVAALHPDRESDPAERARKTELMQKVTVAYGNKDLLQLLELQLSVEQIDQDTIDNIAEDRLRHYNKVLQDQLDEIRDEVATREMEIRAMLHLSPFERLTPKRLAVLLKEDIRTTQYHLTLIQHQLRSFRADVKALKDWLRHYEIPKPDPDPFADAFPPFFD